MAEMDVKMMENFGAALSWEFPYPSQRMPVFGENVVATSQPLAAQAGLSMLRCGGNAVDAAIATAITLTVVEPTSNGIGSDAFALLWNGRELIGINGSGRSPKAMSLKRFAGQEEMPLYGWDTVTVPGAVDLWARLSKRYGKLPFEDLFAPAIGYAREGFMVSPVTAFRWAEAEANYGDLPDFAAAFLPNGRAPGPGQRFCCPEQASTLEEIAATRGESFYRGEIGQKIAAASAAAGGVMRDADLGEHASEWVMPISMEYRGYRLHEIPPNGQGIAALIALGILEHFDMKAHPIDSAPGLHLQIEAMKLGFADAHGQVADPDHMRISAEELLDPERLGRLAETIRPERASSAKGAPPFDRGTVYLTAADENGGMVSFIQSNFAGFGSGVVVPGTGISLQNRGHGFSLTPGHPNVVAGGKRPYHTIIPGFVTRNGCPVMSFGVMGGHMQPQGHVQMMVRIFDYGQNPQTASDAPRWHLCRDGRVALEPGYPPAVIAELNRMGHLASTEPPEWGYGGAQLIFKIGEGYCGASDHRKDGQAVGF